MHSNRNREHQNVHCACICIEITYSNRMPNIWKENEALFAVGYYCVLLCFGMNGTFSKFSLISNIENGNGNGNIHFHTYRSAAYVRQQEQCDHIWNIGTGKATGISTCTKCPNISMHTMSFQVITYVEMKRLHSIN